MEEKNKSLIIATKTFFKKIKDFFINLFVKSENKENNNEEINAESSIEDTLDKEKNNNEEKLDEKEEFFKKYNAYKAHEIDVSELTGSELIKINAMLEEENKKNKEKMFDAMEQYRKSQNSNN